MSGVQFGGRESDLSIPECGLAIMGSARDPSVARAIRTSSQDGRKRNEHISPADKHCLTAPSTRQRCTVVVERVSQPRAPARAPWPHACASAVRVRCSQNPCLPRRASWRIVHVHLVWFKNPVSPHSPVRCGCPWLWLERPASRLQLYVRWVTFDQA